MSFYGIFSGRQVIEEQSTYEELFTEQQFEEERKEYYKQKKHFHFNHTKYYTRH